MYTIKIVDKTSVFVEKDGKLSFSWRCESEEQAKQDVEWLESIKDNEDAVLGFILTLQARHPEEWENVKKSINAKWTFSVE